MHKEILIRNRDTQHQGWRAALLLFASLKVVAATLETCVGRHDVYRQQLVDEATWKSITRHLESSTPK